MVKALIGSNNFALRRRLTELVDSFISKHGKLAVERIDAKDWESQSIIDSIQSMPFLSEKKMVVLRDLSANKQAAEQIEQIISAAGSSSEVIIYDPEVDRRTGYFKTLQKATSIEVFNDPDPRSLAVWLVEEAKKQKAELSISDANYLVERVGSGQSLLFNELDKLITYEPKISRDNIDLLTEQAPRSRVFELLDAAFGGNKERALKLYDEQRAQKVEPQAIMAMITWQLHLLTAVKYAKGRQLPAVAADMNMKLFPVSKAAGLARKIDEPKLKSLVDDAFDIDLKSKTSAIDLDEALKTYIVTM